MRTHRILRLLNGYHHPRLEPGEPQKVQFKLNMKIKINLKIDRTSYPNPTKQKGMQ